MIGSKWRPQYYGVVVVALFVYDYFLTLQDEVNEFPSSHNGVLTFWLDPIHVERAEIMG